MRKFNILAPSRDQPANVGHAIGSDEIGAELYNLEDGQSGTPYHFHHGAEEWIYVVSGSPTVRTPDGERVLERGDVLCFAPGPDGAHEVIGPGSVLVIAERHALDIVEFPESGTIKALPSGETYRSADAQ